MNTQIGAMPVDLIQIDRHTSGLVSVSLDMRKPLRPRDAIITQTPQGCWPPMSTPEFDGRYDVTAPVAVEGGELDNAVMLNLAHVLVACEVTSWGAGNPIEEPCQGKMTR